MKVLRSLLLLCLTAAAPLPAELTRETFLQLEREIEPVSAAWDQIPWHANLVSAQQQAHKEGKPLFIWAMDGHPLGCT